MPGDTEESDALLRGVAAAPAMPRPAPDLVGATIEQYRIAGLLGRGGMGVVYRAEDTRLHRTVAIKVLPGGRADDHTQRERFLREARAAAAVAHPNIVTIYEVVEHDGRILLVMELVTGVTLAERLARERLAPSEAVRIARGIARGLARAHANAIVHRDLKPGNVMLDADGDPKILDFGLAKPPERDDRAGYATTEGTIMGTPAYMSPEQARGERVDVRSDVFSLGAMLYEMLAGRAPFSRPSLSETLAAILRDPHPPLHDVVPDVPPQVEDIIDRCLAKPAGDRYASAAELLVALEACAPESTRSAMTSPGRRVRARIALALALALALGAAAVGAAVLAWPRTHDEPRAPEPPAKIRAITDWPAPKTSSPEAAALYAEALQAFHDGTFHRANRDLRKAIELDPHFAAARLRIISMGLVPDEDLRQMLNAAAESRALLDARDARFLALLQSVIDAPDPTARVASVRRFATDLANDPEAQLLAAGLLGTPAEEVNALITRALTLDPSFAAAEALAIDVARGAGDPDRALATVERCLKISPTASACLRQRADIHASRGQCDAFGDDTRDLVVKAPEADFSYDYRLIALAAQGAPADALRELAHKSEALANSSEARELAAANAARIAIYEGDFVTAEAKFVELENNVALATDETMHFPAVYRMFISNEEGNGAKARAAAEDYLHRHQAWTYGGQPFPRAYALALDRRYHGISDHAARAQRDAWIAEDDKLGLPRANSWAMYYAWPAETADEGREAIAALPAFEPLDPAKFPIEHQSAIGRAFVLAGEVDRGIPLLRATTTWCGPTPGPLTVGWQAVMVLSHYYLGLALEQKGDKEGACSSYIRVLQRWGHARPRSTTGDSARKHAKALGCVLPAGL